MQNLSDVLSKHIYDNMLKNQLQALDRSLRPFGGALESVAKAVSTLNRNKIQKIRQAEIQKIRREEGRYR